eukprot:354132-Chlamydomonas_euryale.AAC.2
MNGRENELCRSSSSKQAFAHWRPATVAHSSEVIQSGHVCDPGSVAPHGKHTCDGHMKTRQTVAPYGKHTCNGHVKTRQTVAPHGKHTCNGHVKTDQTAAANGFSNELRPELPSDEISTMAGWVGMLRVEMRMRLNTALTTQPARKTYPAHGGRREPPDGRGPCVWVQLVHQHHGGSNHCDHLDAPVYPEVAVVGAAVGVGRQRELRRGAVACRLDRLEQLGVALDHEAQQLLLLRRCRKLRDCAQRSGLLLQEEFGGLQRVVLEVVVHSARVLQRCDAAELQERARPAQRHQRDGRHIHVVLRRHLADRPAGSGSVGGGVGAGGGRRSWRNLRLAEAAAAAAAARTCGKHQPATNLRMVNRQRRVCSPRRLRDSREAPRARERCSRVPGDGSCSFLLSRAHGAAQLCGGVAAAARRLMWHRGGSCLLRSRMRPRRDTLARTFPFRNPPRSPSAFFAGTAAAAADARGRDKDCSRS